MKRPVVVPHAEVIDLRSVHADADFQIWIASPVEGTRPFPPGPRQCLYVLDANLFFGTAVEMTRLMSQLHGELPPLLVVGIAYATTDPVLQAELRARDFTPTVEPGFEAMLRSVPGARAPSLPEDRRLGRAPEFLDFLTREVRPLVEASHEVADGGSVLFGSSLGGLFAVWAMMERPDAFDAYVAVSPALWWDDGALLLRASEALPGTGDGKSLFLAVGAEEERPDIPMLARFKMVSNVRALADLLRSRNRPTLDVATFVPEGESHTSVVPTALTRGLRHVLGPRRPGSGVAAARPGRGDPGAE